MSERKALFIQHYRLNPDATIAALLAGYSRRYAVKAGARLVNDPVVKAALEENGKDNGETVGGEGKGNGEKLGEEANRQPLFELVKGEEPTAEGDSPDGPVSVDWVVREAKRTYDAAHSAGSLSTAVSCLNLIGKHLEGKGGEGEAGFCGVTVVTGIEGAPGSDVSD